MIVSFDSRTAICTRQIQESDFVEVINLLARGFGVRSHRHWQRALAQLASHPTPEGLPRYGYLLECGNRPVGVILLIFCAAPGGGAAAVRCNVSSFYVEPQFRSHASMLIAQAVRHSNVTYVNISPTRHTRAIIEAQGFSCYCNGQFISIPALNRSGERARIIDFDSSAEQPRQDRLLLLDHRSYGGISLWCRADDGTYPFVFIPRRIKGLIPCAQLIYCREVGDFVRFAGVIGRYLARRGWPLVAIDSNGPIAGLAGRYFDDRKPKYFKGAEMPKLADLAYTEAAMFGPLMSRVPTFASLYGALVCEFRNRREIDGIDQIESRPT